MRILVTNDDGLHSAGIAALASALDGLGEVWVVAPDRERSGASHSITLHHPLRIWTVAERRLMVDGSPGDCVYVAVNHLFKDERPALVVSGINHGPNVADDITYSGTVAAALEATMLGIPAVAFSQCGRGVHDFTAAARFARGLVGTVLREGLSPGTLLNVNVPKGSDGETYRLTRQGKRSYAQEVLEKVDPRGKRYYWIGGDELAHEDIPGSDCNAVYDDKVISVTPLHLDMTHDETRRAMQTWDIPGRRLEGPGK
jgi:5'-nucleotidase